MTLLAIGAAALAVGCGSSSDDQRSGARASAPAATSTVPGQTTVQSDAKAAAKSTKKAAEKAGADASSPATKRTSKAAKKAAILKANAGSRAERAQRAKFAKKAIKANQNQIKDAYAKIERKAEKARAKLKAEVGTKVGPSGIPIAVNKTCQQQLRTVDGALRGGAKAKELPGVLNATIGKLKVLASQNSPAASGTTGDFAGRIRAQAIVDALRKALAPAKKFAGGGSSGDLAAALKELSNASQLYELRSCRIS